MKIEIDKPKTEIEVNTMSPLIWAYIGDSVYELYIRTYLIETTKLNPHYLHVQATKYVKAKSQAKILEKLNEFLTEEEQDIVRRTRNTRKSSFTQKYKCIRICLCYCL